MVSEVVGSIDNTVIAFNIWHSPGVELDYLDITICPRIDTGFTCKTTINGISPEDIDSLCSKLQSLKANLKYRS